MPTSGELSELQQVLTEKAVQIGQALGAWLDFSHESVDAVEQVLGALHDEYATSGSDDGYVGIALEFAAYIITVIERNLSLGTWQRDHDEMGPETFPYTWEGTTIFPYGWCMKRLLDGPADNVATKYEALVLRHRTQAAQHGTAAGRSHLRCFAMCGGIGRINRYSNLFPSARAVTAVLPVGRLNQLAANRVTSIHSSRFVVPSLPSRSPLHSLRWPFRITLRGSRLGTRRLSRPPATLHSRGPCLWYPH